MPSRVYWLEEPIIMVAEYSGAVTTEDLDEALKMCLAYLEDHTIYFLVDLESADSIPTNLLKLASLNQIIDHERSRWFAFLQPNTLVKFAMQVMMRNHARVFDNRDAAVAFLRERIDDEKGISDLEN